MQDWLTTKELAGLAGASQDYIRQIVIDGNAQT